MEENRSVGKNLVFILSALLFLGAFFTPRGSLAAGPAPARNVNHVEAKIIHVDQYAVYAPNLVFYFDPQMDKKKAAALAKAANQLRNREALITYSSTDELGKDRHVLLVDIAPAERFGGEPAPKEAKAQAPPPVEEASPIEEKPYELKPPPPPAPAPHRAEPEPRAVPAGKAITKEELAAFVRHILDLNERKDLPAILPCYAREVNYYDRGTVSRDAIAKDLGYYFRNWSEIRTSLSGEVTMIVLDPEVRTIIFNTSFAVRNDRKAVSGRTENIWKIQRIDGRLQIIDVKQKIINRGVPGM